MELDDLRKQIDEIDEELVALLNRRAEIVVQIGKLKSTDGTPIYVPDREKKVLDKIRQANKGPLPDKSLAAIYRELMSGSFALEKPLRITYLGPQGSFSHLAAVEKFGASVEYEPVNDIRGVFEEVTREHADFGVVPIENSFGGGVIDTLDALIDTKLNICAEINRVIHHNLLARCKLEEVERVYSKPEVFAQCQRWLGDTNLIGKTIAVASTSKAAEMALNEDGSAAIGSTLAAELYSLKIICANIEDNANNITRFFIIGREANKDSGDDKTSIVFTTRDEPGALVDVLDAFRQAGINMSFIESRPSKLRNWEYYFFVDVIAHRSELRLQEAVKNARIHCLGLNVLGSYPRASEVI
ncbi:MAG: prephenate dehydratase [Planctomycetota bacterium]|nr:MAG: prephenate dehydratase [Planctomycetota bacterium]